MEPHLADVKGEDPDGPSNPGSGAGHTSNMVTCVKKPQLKVNF